MKVSKIVDYIVVVVVIACFMMLIGLALLYKNADSGPYDPSGFDALVDLIEKEEAFPQPEPEPDEVPEPIGIPWEYYVHVR